jgi:transcriptional regulator with XRE-family HTH domain
MSTLAQRIREIRYKKGLGPDALAARAEISRTALYQIECGKTEVPRAGTLRRIAQALEVPVDQLLGNRPTNEDTENSAGYSSRPMMENGRSSLNPAQDWSYSEEPDLTEYAEPKRNFGSADHRDDLNGMLEDLLDSRYGDTVARVIQEMHKLLAPSRQSASISPRSYADIRYRSPR